MKLPRKSRLSDLAVFGGASAFAEQLHVGRPAPLCADAFLRRTQTVLQEARFTNNGPMVRELEAKLAEKLGVGNCVLVSNGTIALELVFRALDLTGEIILPSFTFIATAHAALWSGLTPVFCDADPATHNIDPGGVARLITPRTAAIVGVHLWGRPCPVGDLTRLADAAGIPLLFDAAHAFGCLHGGRPIGTFGTAEVFSLHATKCFSTFEGGAIATHDDALAAKIRSLRNFGFAGYDTVTALGTNAKLPEVSAAMGLSQLEVFDKVLAINKERHDAYRRNLKGVQGVTLATTRETDCSNHHYVVLDIDPASAGLSRDQLLRILHAENVLARRYFYPGCHRSAPYAGDRRFIREPLPQTERLCDRVLCLPSGPAVSLADIETVCDILRSALSRSHEVATRLGAGLAA